MKKQTKNISDDINIIDLIPYETSDYIECIGKYMEKIENRLRLAFVRCPKCRQYISIYKDEISSNGQTKMKKCLCGFKKALILKKWKI